MSLTPRRSSEFTIYRNKKYITRLRTLYGLDYYLKTPCTVVKTYNSKRKFTFKTHLRQKRP